MPEPQKGPSSAHPQVEAENQDKQPSPHPPPPPVDETLSWPSERQPEHQDDS